MRLLRALFLVVAVLAVLWRINIAVVSQRLEVEGHRAEADYSVMADPFGLLEHQWARVLVGRHSLAVVNAIGCTIWLTLALGAYGLVYKFTREHASTNQE
jgi:hypothetical protein